MRTKIIVGALFAVLVVMATAATASAEFKAEAYPAKVMAKAFGPSGKQIFKTGAGTVQTECTEASFSSTESSAGPGEQLKMGAEYLNCNAKTSLGERSAKVAMNQCSYNFHQAKGATSGTVTLECPTGSEIKIESEGCVIFVKSENQTGPLSSVGYENNAAEGSTPKMVTVKPAVEGITSTVGSGEFICGLGGVMTGKEGKYTGNALAEGLKTNDGAKIGIEVG